MPEMEEARSQSGKGIYSRQDSECSLEVTQDNTQHLKIKLHASSSWKHHKSLKKYPVSISVAWE